MHCTQCTVTTQQSLDVLTISSPSSMPHILQHTALYCTSYCTVYCTVLYSVLYCVLYSVLYCTVHCTQCTVTTQQSLKSAAIVHATHFTSNAFICSTHHFFMYKTNIRPTETLKFQIICKQQKYLFTASLLHVEGSLKKRRLRLRLSKV